MKKLIKAAAVLLTLAVLLSAGLLSALYLYNRPSEGIPSEGAVFEVEEGQSLTAVSKRLAERGLIRSHYLLRGISRVERTGAAIKSGYYRIPPGMSTAEVHELLVRGEQTLHRVTIPEGLTISEIALEFEEENICGAEDFIAAATSAETSGGGASDESSSGGGASGESSSETEEPSHTGTPGGGPVGYAELLSGYPIPKGIDSLEGFLFPDTYLFQRNFPAEKVVAHMIDTFFDNLREIAPGYTELSAEELYRKIIIASIVEREYRASDEAKKIASVFYNRLERGMRLQSCATVVYVLTEKQEKEHPKKLTYEDLEVESDFNTYTRGGLPPSPIANPGAVALEATFHPADTDYLYFLLQDPEDGRHTFSKTLSEHNEAYRLYIKQ